MVRLQRGFTVSVFGSSASVFSQIADRNDKCCLDGIQADIVVLVVGFLYGRVVRNSSFDRLLEAGGLSMRHEAYRQQYMRLVVEVEVKSFRLLRQEEQLLVCFMLEDHLFQMIQSTPMIDFLPHLGAKKNVRIGLFMMSGAVQAITVWTISFPDSKLINVLDQSATGRSLDSAVEYLDRCCPRVGSVASLAIVTLMIVDEIFDHYFLLQDGSVHHFFLQREFHLGHHIETLHRDIT